MSSSRRYKRRQRLGRNRADDATDKQRGPNGLVSATCHWPGRCDQQAKDGFASVSDGLPHQCSGAHATNHDRQRQRHKAPPLPLSMPSATPTGPYRTIFYSAGPAVVGTRRLNASTTNQSPKRLKTRIFHAISTRPWVPTRSGFPAERGADWGNKTPKS